jgi:hypothetical protein
MRGVGQRSATYARPDAALTDTRPTGLRRNVFDPYVAIGRIENAGVSSTPASNHFVQ